MNPLQKTSCRGDCHRVHRSFAVTRAAKPDLPAIRNGHLASRTQFAANSARTTNWIQLRLQLERTDSASGGTGRRRWRSLPSKVPPGLADRPSEYLGVMTRPASRDSEQIQPDLDTRFRNSRFGGTPAVNPDAVLAREAFRQRTHRQPCSTRPNQRPKPPSTWDLNF